MSEYICKDPRFNKLKVSCFLISANLAKWFQNDNTTKKKTKKQRHHPGRATLTVPIQNRLSYDSKFSQ